MIRYYLRLCYINTEILHFTPTHFSHLKKKKGLGKYFRDYFIRKCDNKKNIT